MLKNKRLAIVFTASILGGHELMAVNHIKKLQGRGFDLYPFIPDNNEKLISLMKSSSLKFSLHNVHHRRLEIINSFINYRYLAEASSFLKKIHNEFDFIIIVQGDIELGSGFINAASKIPLKNIVSYIPYTHSFRVMGSRLAFVKDILAKVIYRRCDKYITICNQFSNELKKKNSQSQVRILRNFVESPVKLKKFSTNNDITEKRNFLTIIMAGRIYFRQKGQDTLINALKNISSHIHIKLKVIGDGPDFEKLVELSSKLNENIEVVFLGWKDNVWEHSDSFDLLVIPSNYEGVPLIMLEALKREIPIIAPARDGMLDYLGEDSLYAIGSDEYQCLANKITDFFNKRNSKF